MIAHTLSSTLFILELKLAESKAKLLDTAKDAIK